jgi:kynureninase
LESSLEFARTLDRNDNLRDFRDKFHIPKDKNGKDQVYLCGNSLGLMPKSVESHIQQELEDWKAFGVEGHFHAKNPWMPYHEILTDQMANIVGAKASEVVVMNGLSVNLHLMMVSFYKPTKERYKILVDYSPFPSDRYAVTSQLKFHGFDSEEGLMELKPSEGSEIVEMSTIEDMFEKNGSEIALVLIGGVNYYTGQAYDVKKITALGHKNGCVVGFDMAHAAGNLALSLHDDGPDFAAWCTYKYMNSGPGSLSGCFVHERHHRDSNLNRFAGWWGHDKKTRFLMGDEFVPIQSAEGWQLSNPPIFQMAAIKASLEIFSNAGMENLRLKSLQLTQYLEDLIELHTNDKINIITPKNPKERGCQLSIQMKQPNKKLFDFLTEKGVISDWREPDVIRVAPVPLYNTFEDVWNFNEILHEGLEIIK